MEALDYWRLCDELTVNQAALLVAGVDPAGYTNIEQLNADERPTGFDAARHAITSALRRGNIAGELFELSGHNSSGDLSGVIPDTVNPATSRIEVDALRKWLQGRGLKSGFFFPEGSSTPDYLDKNHPRYAPKLAAAVRAWLATDGDAAISGKSPKQALTKWLREQAAGLGMTDDEGKVNETGIEEVAKVANWQLTGGAPKTPGS
jgi:hypothetical protein